MCFAVCMWDVFRKVSADFPCLLSFEISKFPWSSGFPNRLDVSLLCHYLEDSVPVVCRAFRINAWGKMLPNWEWEGQDLQNMSVASAWNATYSSLKVILVTNNMSPCVCVFLERKHSFYHMLFQISSSVACCDVFLALAHLGVAVICLLQLQVFSRLAGKVHPLPFEPFDRGFLQQRLSVHFSHKSDVFTCVKTRLGFDSHIWWHLCLFYKWSSYWAHIIHITFIVRYSFFLFFIKRIQYSTF